MTFKQTSVANRVGVRDTSMKLSNLAQRLTLGSGPVDSILSDEIDTLAIATGKALSNAGYPVQIPNGSALVKDAGAVQVATAGTKTAPAAASVSGNTLNNVKLTKATDGIVSDTDNANVQDRNGVVLKADSVGARVSAGIFTGVFFRALTDAVGSDGTPFDIVTGRGSTAANGRARLYVVANTIRNVVLDNTAALITGNSVPVQNSAGLSIAAGTVTVASNAVSAVKLPQNYTAFADTKAHKVTDAAGRSANATAKVSNGALQDQTLDPAYALVTTGTPISVQDSQGVQVEGGATAQVVGNAKLDNFIINGNYACVKTGSRISVLSAQGNDLWNSLSVLANVQTGFLSSRMPTDSAVIRNGATVTIGGVNYKFTVVDNVITAMTTA